MLKTGKILKAKPVDAEEFYEEMKYALKYFDLDWNEKCKMQIRTVTIDGYERIVFSHGGRIIIMGEEEELS